MIEKTSWEAIEHETLSSTIARRMVSGQSLTVAQVYLKKGAIVPRHSHLNEQFTYIVSGALTLIFDDGRVTLRGGELLIIPPHVPHSAEALEDTLDMDIFVPRREDWINKTDAYLRK
jgi:quercetin dioxygenase-like cupin family protein